MAALDMDRTLCCGEAQNQATGAVFIVWEILNDLTIGNGFSNFLNSDASQDGLIDGMFREFKFIVRNFLADVCDERGHYWINYYAVILVYSSRVTMRSPLLSEMSQLL